MTVLSVNCSCINRIITININRIHDRGNTRRYTFLRSAFIGFDVEGEGTEHAYIVLYMHARNIRFKLPSDHDKQQAVMVDLQTILESTVL
jgi:hypothetical protein